MGRAPRTLSERPGTRRVPHSGRAHPALALQLRSRRDWRAEAGMYGRWTSPAASCTRTRSLLARSPHPGHCAPVTPCSSAYAPARGLPAPTSPLLRAGDGMAPTPLRFGGERSPAFQTGVDFIKCQDGRWVGEGCVVVCPTVRGRGGLGWMLSWGDWLCSAPASAPRPVVRDFATAKVGRWQGVQGSPRFPQKLSVAHATNFSGPELWK